MRKIITTILFLTSSLLISSEIDSTKNESIFKIKENTLGVVIGTAFPEFIYIGTNIHLKKNVYFSFKIGASPALRDLTYITIPMDQFAFSSELYYYFGEKSENFKYGSWNFSVGLTHFDKFETLFDKKTNYIYYLSLRGGKDFKLTDKYVIRTSVGVVSAIYANENKNWFAPSLNFSLLYWL